MGQAGITELHLTGKRQNPHLRHSAAPKRVQILFEDREILVADKPAGLLTIASNSEKRRTAYAQLFDHLKSKRPPEKLFIVHRLDREVSGLLVFAKSPSAKQNLQQQFKDRRASRTYLAVSERRMTKQAESIQSFLAENAIHRCYSTSNPNKGKWAVTHVNVLKRSSQRTLIEVRLETGRKHQIRVHLADCGHPIVGDRDYGSRSNPIGRLALHAVKLAFKHPQTGRRLEFHSAPPPSFQSLV